MDNSILYQEITKKNKFEKDDINESDKSITGNCFKARGLSLEYFLNCIFMDIFSQNELLREIYNFDRRSDEKKDSRESLNLNKNVNEGNIITKKRRIVEMEEIYAVF